jgi:hypothetical protein
MANGKWQMANGKWQMANGNQWQKLRKDAVGNLALRLREVARLCCLLCLFPAAEAGAAVVLGRVNDSSESDSLNESFPNGRKKDPKMPKTAKLWSKCYVHPKFFCTFKE